MSTGLKNWKIWLHPFATVLGAWGGFPQPPKFFIQLSQYELFRWFLVFVLAYQGGAEEDVQRALLITVVFYLVAKLLDLRELVAQSAYEAPPTLKVKENNVAAQQEAKAESAHIQEEQKHAETTPVPSQAPKAEQFCAGCYFM